MKSSALMTPRSSSPGIPSLCIAPKADAEEDAVELAFQCGERAALVDGGAEAKLDAQRANHFDFAQAVGGAQLVFGDAIGIQAAGKRALRRSVTRKAAGGAVRPRRRAKRGRRRCRRLAAARRGGVDAEERRRSGMKCVHGEALQAADLDGLLVVAMHDAGAFAQHFDGADAGTTGAQDVGIENGVRRAAQVAGGDFLDEARHVDVGGAGGGAGRIEAVEAAIGFHQHRRGVERRMNFRKELLKLLRLQMGPEKGQLTLLPKECNGTLRLRPEPRVRA